MSTILAHDSKLVKSINQSHQSFFADGYKYLSFCRTAVVVEVDDEGYLSYLELPGGFSMGFCDLLRLVDAQKLSEEKPDFIIVKFFDSHQVLGVGLVAVEDLSTKRTSNWKTGETCYQVMVEKIKMLN